MEMNEIVPEVEKTPEQIAAEQKLAEAEKKLEDHMEKIVVMAREKLLPYLQKTGCSIEEAQRVMQSMAVTVQQGLFLLLKTNTVGSLNIKEKVSKDYPDYDQYIELLDILEPETMEIGIEALQWMAEKIDSEVKNENKCRKLEDLKLDF